VIVDRPDEGTSGAIRTVLERPDALEAIIEMAQPAAKPKPNRPSRGKGLLEARGLEGGGTRTVNSMHLSLTSHERCVGK
jgi:hypothetical protein